MHLLPDVYKVKSNIGICIMLGIYSKLYLSFSQRRRTWTYAWPRKHVIPWLLFISLCIHAFLEGFPVSHHQDLAVGIAIHHLPIAIILTIFY
jgi:cytochrome c oxidase assembly factor CtaG